MVYWTQPIDPNEGRNRSQRGDNVDMFPFKDDPFTKLCVSASEQ